MISFLKTKRNQQIIQVLSQALLIDLFSECFNLILKF